MGNNLEQYRKLPKGAFVPSHLENWAVVTEYFPDEPGVSLDLSRDGDLTGKVRYWIEAGSRSIAETEADLRENHENISKAFPSRQHPPFDSEIAKRVAGASAVPSRLSILADDGTEYCIFDEQLHGWDAVEMSCVRIKKRTHRDKRCSNCENTTFSIQCSWVGYQVFDDGRFGGDAAVRYRNSFDSICIDLVCCSCGGIEHGFLEAETA